MIHNNELARTLNKDRYRRGNAYRAQAAADRHDIRRAIGRWLEGLGKRLQAPSPSRSSA